MATIKSEDCWNILNNKYTLPETVKKLGGNEVGISEMMEEIRIRDIHDTSTLFSFAQSFKYMAYLILLDRKEVDETNIFNFAKSKVDEGDARTGDFGAKGKEQCVFLNGGWISMKSNRCT